MNNSCLNVALLPLNIEWKDKQANLNNVEKALQQLHPATDLLILPETFSTGFIAGEDKDMVREYAERNTGETIDKIKSWSNKYGIAIAGSFIADSGGSLYNRAFFIEPSGEETFADKRHLFTMAGEDKIFSSGFRRLAVRFRGWNIAIIVCYDIRFPVWCRNVLNEYDLLLAVANWPEARVSAWNQLAVARAIENEAYVCAVNCSGIDSHGFKYDGSSKVVDFKGNDITVCQEYTPFLYASLDIEKLQKFRAKFPAWQDADSFKIL